MGHRILLILCLVLVGVKCQEYFEDYGESDVEYPWYETSPPPCNYTCMDYHCHHGGHCVITASDSQAYCLCPEQYTGAFCEFHVDTFGGSCSDNPCQDGTECLDLGYGGYLCLCPADQMGYNCEHPPSGNDPCTAATCEYGTCLPDLWSDEYYCACEDGYYGPNCDIPVDYDCGCGVHGSCAWHYYSYYNYNYYYYDGDWNFPSYPSYYYHNYTNYYYYDYDKDYYSNSEPSQCVCDPGYTGYNCETMMMSCDDGPCRNGGKCIEFYGNFECQCPENVVGAYCEEGLWGEWSEAGYCSHSCGGGYMTKTRYCSAGYGQCDGRSLEHESCNTHPCSDFDDANSISLEVDIDDAPLVTMNEGIFTEVVAYIINKYCKDDPQECCGYFGFRAKEGWSENFGKLMTGDQCIVNYLDFTSSTIVIKISAYTTMNQLSQFCDVSKEDWEEWDDSDSDDDSDDDDSDSESWDNSGYSDSDSWDDSDSSDSDSWDDEDYSDSDSRDDSDSSDSDSWEDWDRDEDHHGRSQEDMDSEEMKHWDDNDSDEKHMEEDWGYGYGEPDYADAYYIDHDSYYYYNGDRDDKDMIFLSHELLLDILRESENMIEQMTGMEIGDMGPTARGQTGDDDDDDDDDHDEGHPKGLVIGLAVALGLLALILLAIGGVFLYKKLKHPKNTRQATPEPASPSPGLQNMYHQPTTPHDLFLANGVNGMPPAYQQIVMYPGTPPPVYAPNIQNPTYGDLPMTKGALPPINAPEVQVPEGKDPEKYQMNNNPAPPGATIYQVSVPQSLMGEKLPPIHKE